MEHNGKCETCRFWRDIRYSGSTEGRCRKYAPANGNWPITPYDGWCGEYESKNDSRKDDGQ